MKFKLKKLMEEKNIGVKQLAGWCGVTPLTISRIKNNKTKAIKLDIIEKICDNLTCEPSDLFNYFEED
jgi:putative transcriptional regulator